MKSILNKRLLASVLSLAMLCNLGFTPVMASAVEGDVSIGTSSVCTHHTHNADCGFAEGTPCNHEHTDGCYQEVTACTHDHTADCYPVVDSGAEGEATPPDTAEPTECTHICDAESGCINTELDCLHTHDDACGYTEGKPCTFDPADCLECNPADDNLLDSGVVTPAEHTITAFAPLAEDIRYQRAGVDSLLLPQTLTATVNEVEIDLPVTWDGVSDINPKAGGLHVLTANLGGDYTLAEGVELPVITAMVLGQGRIGRNGTAANPLQITNENQLREVSYLVNGGQLESFILGENSTGQVFLKLMKNITLNFDWRPIGVEAYQFKGIFDGNGKTIAGASINWPGIPNIGFFGFASAESCVKDLSLVDVDFAGGENTGGVVGISHGIIENCTVSGNVRGDSNVGGVVGYTNDSITGCTVSGSVTGTGNYVGGIVGNALGNVTGCGSSASVTGSSDIGGVVGNAQGNVTLSYATGKVRGNSDIGGVVGAINEKYITNCYSTGDISGTESSVGGVVGLIDSGTVSGCYATGRISGDTEVGGVVGKTSNSSTVIDCIALNPKISANSSVGRIAGTIDGFASISANAAFALMMDGENKTFAEGDGSDKDGTNINLTTLDGKFAALDVWTDFSSETLPALVGVGQQTVSRPNHLWESPADCTFSGGDGNTTLTAYQIKTPADLNALAYLVNGGKDFKGKYFELGNSITLNSDWTPIGMLIFVESNSIYRPFNGTFDGCGYQITGVSIDRPDENNIGLFGYAGADSEIKNLYVKADIKAGYSVGGVAGYAEGKITGCSVSGSISGVGSVGGVAGELSAAGTVEHCYITGNVKGVKEVGGVIGFAGGAVTNCYATGSVSGNFRIGGLVGYCASSLTMKDCAALNSGVLGNSEVARVSINTQVGSSMDNNVAYAQMKDKYGDTFTPDDGSGINGADIAALDTLDNKFGDTSVWNAFTSTTLPTLKSMGGQTLERPQHLLAISAAYGFSGGSGTSGSPYQISTETDLFALAQLVNKGNSLDNTYFKLTGDIILAGGEWTPIGTEEKPFNGVFDGNGRSISGLEIHQLENAYLGLFGYTGSGSAIKNLSVLNIYIEGKSEIGGVAGYAGGMVTNCSVTGEITATDNNVGGVMGVANDTVTNCDFTGSVFVNGNNVGGVAGCAEGAVTGCYAAGEVIGLGDNVGGIAGSAKSDVTNCYTTSDVIDASSIIGGVVGYAAGAVTSCYATGNVRGRVFVGGVVGKADAPVTKCIALNTGIEGVSSVERVFNAGISGSGKENYGILNLYIIQNGYYKELIKGADQPDGADAIIANIESKAWWQGVGFAAPWILEDNCLPVLDPSADNGLPVFLTPAFSHAPVIAGPAGDTIYEGFYANPCYFGPFDIQGSYPIAVTKQSGDEKIIWDDNYRALVVAAGLTAGDYPVVLEASNVAGTATHTFTLTVISTGGGSDGSGGSGGSGGSSSGSSSGSSAPTVTPSNPGKPDTSTNIKTEVPGKVDASGSATVTVPEKNVTEAIKAAQDAAKKAGTEKNGISVTVNVTTDKAASSIAATLPQKAIDELVKAGVTELKIESDTANITLDLATLKQIQAAGGGSVTVSATAVNPNTLSKKAQAAIGRRPVFNFSIQSGGKAIADFKGGSVSIALHYTPAAGEKPGNLYGVYVDDAGKVTYLLSSSYDANAKLLRFSTNHFSIFGIGCKADAPKFTDTAGHWAKNDIDFVVSRGLFSGTSATTFAPNTSMTRGMFVTALGRLAQADVSGYKQSSFPDVKQGAYYMGYIEWASKNGIVNGGTDGNFRPDAAITREQMAVIMSNYAKTIGFPVPKVHAENTFADSTKISAYATAAVKQMQMAGVLAGKSGNVFDPQGTATRAEVSAVLRRFIELTISTDTAVGWTMNDSGQWMYYENGKPVTGTKTVDGTAYTFDANGVTADMPKNRRYTTYTVQKGDSFWAIARKFNCTMAELEVLNGKSRYSIIYKGDVLKVPEK